MLVVTVINQLHQPAWQIFVMIMWFIIKSHSVQSWPEMMLDDAHLFSFIIADICRFHLNRMQINWTELNWHDLKHLCWWQKFIYFMPNCHNTLCKLRKSIRQNACVLFAAIHWMKSLIYYLLKTTDFKMCIFLCSTPSFSCH